MSRVKASEGFPSLGKVVTVLAISANFGGVLGENWTILLNYLAQSLPNNSTIT
jgi:hypothetical protein